MELCLNILSTVSKRKQGQNNAYNVEQYHKNKERILLQKKEYYKRKKQEKEEENKNEVIIE